MGLALKTLLLSHFRSHKLTRLELSGRPVVLFGANGAGKTNVIEAVSLLSPGRGLRRSPVGEMSRRPETLGWKIAATLSHEGGQAEVETAWTGEGGRSVRIDDKIATQSRLGTLARVVWLVPSMDRLWIEGAEGRRRFLDRMTLSFRPAHGDAVLTYERAMRERNRLLKDQVADQAWYLGLERQMAEAAALIRENRQHCLTQLETGQAAAHTEFPVAELSLEGPDAEDLEDALARNRMQDMAAGRTLIGPHRADLDAVYAAKGVGAKDCSTGEQKALLISLILANARALSAEIGTPPLLLLDEVAAHLDRDRQSALYEEIDGLSAQAWMTGTGPEHFSPWGDRAQHFEVSDGPDGSQVVPYAL